MKGLNVKEDTLFIKSNVPSSKNSRVFNTKLKRSFGSKTTQNYTKNTKQQYVDLQQAFLNLLENKRKPYVIQLHFIRDSKRKWDFHNICQIVLDLMVKYEWIEDDNLDEVVVIPFKIDGRYYTVDKENSGVLISIGDEGSL